MAKHRYVKGDNGESIRLTYWSDHATGRTVYVNGRELGTVRMYSPGYGQAYPLRGTSVNVPSYAEGGRALARMLASGWFDGEV